MILGRKGKYLVSMNTEATWNKTMKFWIQEKAIVIDEEILSDIRLLHIRTPYGFRTNGADYRMKFKPHETDGNKTDVVITVDLFLINEAIFEWRFHNKKIRRWCQLIGTTPVKLVRY